MKFKCVDKNQASLHDIKMRLLNIIMLISSFWIFESASASTQLIGMDDETIVYSGPSFNYRPIYILKLEASVSVAKELFKTKEGTFFKVIVDFKDGRRAIGYIPQAANVRLKTDLMDDDDFTKYSELGLARSSISTAFSYYRGDSYMVMLGYQRYKLPGFYTKYYLGEWINQTSSGHHLGFELGNDALITKQVSGFVAYAGGFLFPTKDDAIFVGSKTSSLNYVLRGVAGLKFNESGGISFSLGGTQTVLFNPNNSYVSFGAQASIEVGI